MKQNFLILAITLMISACGSDSQTPEDEVRNTLNLVQEAAQERSLSSFMDNVSEQYSDHKGNDKEAIKRLVQLLFLRNQSINIFTLIHSIELQDNIAAVEVSAAMAARGVDLNQETNRLKADRHRFSVVLQNTNDTWLIQSVSWERGWAN